MPPSSSRRSLGAGRTRSRVPGQPSSTKTSRRFGRNFIAVGASRLLLSALVEQRSDLRLVSEAIPGAAITVVRLHAPLSALEQRIRQREPAGPEGELVGARWWTQHFSEARVEDYVVETENQPVDEIAREVLRLADWLT
jgi:chloramphenicol 3-O-phosphotransferase